MRPTGILEGARRFPLISKQARKDFYKGNSQAYAPGAGVRTGAPGRHAAQRGEYRILDDKVRVFVGPSAKVLNSGNLKPYVYTGTDPRPLRGEDDRGVFDTMPRPDAFKVFQRHAQHIDIAPDKRKHLPLTPERNQNVNPRYWDEWKLLSEEQKEGYKMVARRLWWDEYLARTESARAGSL